MDRAPYSCAFCAEINRYPHLLEAAGCQDAVHVTLSDAALQNLGRMVQTDLTCCEARSRMIQGKQPLSERSERGCFPIKIVLL